MLSQAAPQEAEWTNRPRPVVRSLGRPSQGPGEARRRFVWVADVLPDEVAPGIAAMMDQGLAVIERTLESREH
jgi:hypothetical protein